MPVVVVIGGGHAGVEAAIAASTVGCGVKLITPSTGKIALMSCNPAIGGIAKGTLVREIDGLGGAIAESADRTALQFRMLNMKKVSKTYRTDTVETHALREFSLTVDEGEFVSVTGPSGSGKTTFLNIAGML